MTSRGAVNSGFSLWPETASVGAEQVDLVYLALLGLTLFFVILLGALALGFGVKYRVGRAAHRREVVHKTHLEVVWITAAALITLAVCLWGTYVYVDAVTPPPDARNIYVVGKQWMWKVSHPQGPREINELHVPAGVPVKINLTSQDVIHSFYIPAFRLKRDVLPQTYTSLWFNATRPGEYHLFCAEYCGAEHARMRGRVIVMEPAEFQRWLSDSKDLEPEPIPNAELAEARSDGHAEVFARYACGDCHKSGPTPEGPTLVGLFGQPVRLRDGRTVVADEEYIRQSIMEPNAAVALGQAAPSTMPTYAGQVDDEHLWQLIEFVKSLGADAGGIGPTP